MRLGALCCTVALFCSIRSTLALPIPGAEDLSIRIGHDIVNSHQLMQKFGRTLSFPSPTDTTRFLQKATMEAPKVIGQATKEANKALKLTANDFLGSGVKRKSVAGTYAGLGAVGLGAGAIGYNAVNMEAKQAEQQAKRIKNEVANKHFCAKERERAAKAAIDKRALTDEGLAAVEDYSKFIATTEAVVGSALAVKTANMNYQASRADLQAMRC